MHYAAAQSRRHRHRRRLQRLPPAISQRSQTRLPPPHRLRAQIKAMLRRRWTHPNKPLPHHHLHPPLRPVNCRRRSQRQPRATRRQHRPTRSPLRRRLPPWQWCRLRTRRSGSSRPRLRHWIRLSASSWRRRSSRATTKRQAPRAHRPPEWRQMPDQARRRNLAAVEMGRVAPLSPISTRCRRLRWVKLLSLGVHKDCRQPLSCCSRAMERF